MDAQELLNDYVLAIEANAANLLASYYCFPCTFFIDSGNRTFLNNAELESYLRPELEKYESIGLRRVKAVIHSTDEQSLSHLLVSAKFSLFDYENAPLFQFNSKIIMQRTGFDLKIAGIFTIDEHIQLNAAYKRSQQACYVTN